MHYNKKDELNMDRKRLIEVYQDTVKIVNDKEYTTEKGNIVNICGEEEMMGKTVFHYSKIKLNYDKLERYKDATVQVVNNDCLYEAKRLVDMGLKPAVLNMASFSMPGGGVINGSSAQEEEIFRRTNIFKSLYQFHNIGKSYGIKERQEHYPLDYNYGGIYTPSVTVFKGGRDADYPLLDEPFMIDVISVAAIKNPLVEHGKIVPYVKKVLFNKVSHILNMALVNGNDSLVLSAFGCGAYRTPPTDMADIMHRVIHSKEFIDTFKKIQIAIIEVPSTIKEHNPNGNFKPFSDIFNSK